ncbi:MAG TPA: response regulator [Candidatus Methylacidiphilales bacterium]
MLRQGLILTSHREYAQTMRPALLTLGDEKTRVDIELDALRALQLVPHHYDLILLDRVLDAMDGLQLLQLMKQQAPSSTFVVISDTADETSRAQAYQNGADLFLKRPRGAVALKKALEEIATLFKKDSGDKIANEQEDGAIARIIDVVQTRCLSGDSVLLVVHGKHQSGEIFIYRGEIFHAQCPNKSGDGAFYEMSQWEGGLVHVKTLKLSHVPPRTIETHDQKLLDRAKNLGPLISDSLPRTGQLVDVLDHKTSDAPVSNMMTEAPPLEEEESQAMLNEGLLAPHFSAVGETPLPTVNVHWKVNLMGELVEGSQMADPQRCAFITYFIYRKLADVAVALEVDYFNHMILLGSHLQQVLVADNMGIRHAVFDTPWTTEAQREQYVKWCREQSF